jgi:hypothetical protein
MNKKSRIKRLLIKNIGSLVTVFECHSPAIASNGLSGTPGRFFFTRYRV